VGGPASREQFLISEFQNMCLKFQHKGWQVVSACAKTATPSSPSLGGIGAQGSCQFSGTDVKLLSPDEGEGGDGGMAFQPWKIQSA